MVFGILKPILFVPSTGIWTRLGNHLRPLHDAEVPVVPARFRLRKTSGCFSYPGSSQPKRPPIHPRSPKTADATRARQALHPTSVSPGREPLAIQQDLSRVPKVPSDLLEEVRSRRRAQTSEQEQDRSETPSGQANDAVRSKDTDSREAVIDHDEEEHIAAAIYYPHPGPTAEQIEQFKSPGDSPEIDALDQRLLLAREDTPPGNPSVTKAEEPIPPELSTSQ